MIKKVVFLVTCSLVLMACKDKKNQTEKSSDPEKGLTAVIPREASYAFVGTYTRNEGFVNGQAEGVYLLKRNEDDASLLKQKVAAEVTNPSYLAVSPDRNNLYVVSEVGREGETGAVHVYDLSDFRNPVHLQEISTDAKAPCYVGLDGKGDYVFAVNYAGGVVKMYKRDKKGMLTPADAVQLHGSGPDKDRQAESHPHSLFLSPDNRFAYVPDLGSDKIWTFRIDREQHKLLPLSDGFVATRPGAGPRHIAFHPNGKYAYLINELDNTVNAYAFDSETGILSEIQTLSTLPKILKEPAVVRTSIYIPTGDSSMAPTAVTTVLWSMPYTRKTGNYLSCSFNLFTEIPSEFRHPSFRKNTVCSQSEFREYCPVYYR